MRIARNFGQPERGLEVFADFFERCQFGWHITEWEQCLPPYEHTESALFSFGIGFAAFYVAVFRVAKT